MRINEHSLESLRKVVRDLQQENQALKAILEENSIPFESRNVLEEQFLPDEYDEDQGARILPYYPNEDMAREFYSYFWGRMDVFAKRGRKGGYFPQCAARWNNSLCPKARDEKAFCDEDCQYKSWKPLELWMIVQHLRGEKEDCTDVIGVYPLFTNNTCRFLVFDFDNHEKDSYKNDDANENDLWKSEVDALRRICEINGIDSLTERSRSGRGAHIWISSRVLFRRRWRVHLDMHCLTAVLRRSICLRLSIMTECTRRRTCLASWGIWWRCLCRGRR